MQRQLQETVETGIYVKSRDAKRCGTECTTINPQDNLAKHSVVALIVGTLLGTTGSMICMGLCGAVSPKPTGKVPVEINSESSENENPKITTQRNDAKHKES